MWIQREKCIIELLLHTSPRPAITQHRNTTPAWLSNKVHEAANGWVCDLSKGNWAGTLNHSIDSRVTQLYI